MLQLLHLSSSKSTHVHIQPIPKLCEAFYSSIPKTFTVIRTERSPELRFFVSLCKNTLTKRGALDRLEPRQEAPPSQLRGSRGSHLPDHAVPRAPHQLAVLAVGHQVEVVGELDGARELLQNVDAEALAAQFGVGLGVTDGAALKRRDDDDA